MLARRRLSLKLGVSVYSFDNPSSKMKLLIMTPSLLHTLLHSHPQLPKSVWYIVCSVTLSALNRPEEIATVFRVAVGIDEDDAPAEEHRVKDVLTHDGQLRIARRIREALIKSAAVLGVPKVRLVWWARSLLC